MESQWVPPSSEKAVDYKRDTLFEGARPAVCLCVSMCVPVSVCVSVCACVCARKSESEFFVCARKRE